MAELIQTRLPKRQTVLFLLALAAPCLVLAGLGLQVSRQERQLAERRTVEDRQRTLAQFRADLVTGLDRVKRQAVAGHSHHAVVLTATVRDGDLILPFDSDAHARDVRRALERSDFGGRIRAAEREEIARRYIDAAVYYRNALAAARLPWERAYAELLLARAEGKAGRVEESRKLYRSVLWSPAELQDEFGIPLALYAAEAIPQSDRSLQRVLREQAGALPHLATPALAMARDLAVKLGAVDLLPQLNRLIGEREQADALQAEFPRLVARLRASDAVWISYGKPLWLLTLASSPGGDLLVAVSGDRLDKLPGRLAREEGEPLGEGFPGLRAVLVAPPATNAALGRLFLTLALTSVVGLTLVAGFLLWRDLLRTERLADMRSHFISSVSHELRTPLTSIRMFTESMRLDDEMDAETRAQYLDTVLHESERLSRLVDNVLHFARIEQGRAVYALRAVRLSEVVDQVVRAFAPLAEQSGSHLEVRVEPCLPCVIGDRDTLEQAILNLLGNAVKYSRLSREIALRAEREGGSAAIRVIDHGIGIAPKDQARIFERFYRGATAEKLQVAGAGLGLTLVDHIAKAHGGSISVESQLGVGSTFTLRIPFAPEATGAWAPEHT